MPTIYSIVSDANLDYLNTIVRETGLSRGRVINQIITEARNSGWTIEIGTARIIASGGQQPQPS